MDSRTPFKPWWILLGFCLFSLGQVGIVLANPIATPIDQLLERPKNQEVVLFAEAVIVVLESIIIQRFLRTSFIAILGWVLLANTVSFLIPNILMHFEFNRLMLLSIDDCYAINRGYYVDVYRLVLGILYSISMAILLEGAILYAVWRRHKALAVKAIILANLISFPSLFLLISYTGFFYA